MNPTNYIASKETKDSHSLTDILKGMLYYIPTEKILGSPVYINRTIHKIKPNYSLLNDFIFSEKGISSLSQKLLDVLFGLLLIGGIYYPWPSLPHYSSILKVRPGFKKVIKEVTLLKFSKEELKQLEEITNDYILKQPPYSKLTRILIQNLQN